MPKFDAKARTRLAGLSERERAAAVGPLLKKLKSDDDPSDDVLAYVATSDASAAWDYLAALAKSSDEEMRHTVALALETAALPVPPPSRAVAIVRSLLNDSDDYVREAAIRAAGNVKGQALFDLLERIDGHDLALADALVRCIPHVEDMRALFPRIDKWLSPKSVWQGCAHDCIRAP